LLQTFAFAVEQSSNSLAIHAPAHCKTPSIATTLAASGASPRGEFVGRGTDLLTTDFPLWTVVRVRLHIGYAKVLLPSCRSEAHTFAKVSPPTANRARKLLVTEQRVNRRLAAILAADVVGYSRLMGADEAGTLAALKRHREAVFDPAVAAHNGRI